MLLPRLPLFIAALVSSVFLVGCSTPLTSGPRTGEDRDIDGAVTAVDLDGFGRVRLTVGAEPSLHVTAGRNVLDDVVTEVRDGVLHLDVRGGGLRMVNQDITYDVVLPEVQGITVGGAGDVEALLEPGDALAVALDGAGRIVVDGVDVDVLRVEIGGAGEVELVGSAQRQSVTLDGVGTYSGENLDSVDAEVVVGGAGSADVLVTGSLDARVDGVGSISYAGGADVTEQVDGAGSVHAR
jgi:hypothetical protein